MNSRFAPDRRGTHGHPWLDDPLWLWRDYYLVNTLTAFDGILRRDQWGGSLAADRSLHVLSSSEKRAGSAQDGWRHRINFVLAHQA